MGPVIHDFSCCFWDAFFSCVFSLQGFAHKFRKNNSESLGGTRHRNLFVIRLWVRRHTILAKSTGRIALTAVPRTRSGPMGLPVDPGQHHTSFSALLHFSLCLPYIVSSWVLCYVLGGTGRGRFSTWIRSESPLGIFSSPRPRSQLVRN